MAPPSVDLLYQDHVWPLSTGADAPIVPEGVVGLRVVLSAPAEVRLNDEPLPLIWSPDGLVGYAQIDLTNQIGFHQITLHSGVRTSRFDFRTESAKATWTEIETMAQRLAQQVFGLKRQFFYSLPDGTRRAVWLPEIEFGWLRERVPEISALVHTIARRPGTESRRRLVTSFQGRGLAVPQTHAHFRQNPQLLENLRGGPIVVEDATYWPACVKARITNREPARREHEQLAFFLRAVASACQRVHEALDTHARDRVLQWSRMIAEARQYSLIQRHDRPGIRMMWSTHPTLLQKTDARYRRLRELHAEYLMNFAVVETGTDAIRLNVKDVWEIYQAYVAHSIGHAFGLGYASKRADLRHRDRLGRSMFSETLSLYYDLHPPAALLPSWRDATTRPANERPDVLLIDEVNQRAALLDAKFRRDANPELANAADIQEAQAYLQSFSVAKAGIVFPGTRACSHHVAANGNLILEIPLRPALSEPDAMLRKAIEELWVPLPRSVPVVNEAGARVLAL